MTVNPNLSVYRVPFTFTVTGNAFVIAESEADALRQATRSADIGDYISAEDNEVSIDSERGELVDTGPVAVGDDVKQVVSYPDYEVGEHPDYEPTEHDEPADEPAEVAPGRPEGLRS